MAKLRVVQYLSPRRLIGRMALALSLLILVAMPRRTLAEESYFMLVFAHQAHTNLPRFTHTFATFVKATAEGPGVNEYAIESHTISWSPATGQIRALRLRPESGVNLDLDASLRWARSVDARVSCWGPFRIRKELYDRALRQIARLQAGGVQYKALDAGFRPHAASNCIHAVSDIDQDNGLLDTGTADGEAASYLVVRHLERWIDDPGQKYDWVYDQLGLRQYPIVRRDLGAL
jgi:hypothetical protein